MSQKIHKKIKIENDKWLLTDVIDFKVYRIIEFSSERKRMSILVQDPEDGLYKLYCKGADSIIKDRLNFADLDDIEDTESFLKRASLQGLRTLMFAMKILTKEEVQEFILDCKDAEEDHMNSS